MDIGTAKATAAEQKTIPHHLIDIRNPDEDYTVADYKRDAVAAIRAIIARSNMPILVGGTGLYVRAVVENLDIPRVVAEPAIRAAIEKEIKEEGLAAVFKKLVALDPEAEYIVDPKNPRRVVRALEVARATGRPFTAQRKKQVPLFDALELGISLPWENLRERIEKRIDVMIEEGLVDEVRALVEAYGDRIATFDAIGYREIIAHLRGETSLDAAVADMKLNTIHYAKRQLTWFKKDKNIRWVTDAEKAKLSVIAFL